jgi:two-component system, NtrC family, sensor histidine kinase HydH
MEGRARKQKVNVIAELPSEPMTLMIDTEQVNQVFVNLLLNALDALPRGGTIVVEVAGQALNGQSAHRGGEPSTVPLKQALVRVRDTGPGIAPRIRERLFQPFVTSKETGVGLGLSICKRLIEAHGGTIRGDNLPEGGAEFVFTLPQNPEGA